MYLLLRMQFDIFMCEHIKMNKGFHSTQRLGAPNGVDEPKFEPPNPPVLAPNPAFEPKPLLDPKVDAAPLSLDANDPNPEFIFVPAPNEEVPVDEPKPGVLGADPNEGALLPNPEGFPNPLGDEPNGLALVAPKPVPNFVVFPNPPDTFDAPNPEVVGPTPVPALLLLSPSTEGSRLYFFARFLKRSSSLP